MPRRSRKQRGAAPQQHTVRLDTLPRDANLILEGGMRALGLFVRDEGRTVQPQMALWVDGASGMIRASSVIAPDEADEDGILGALEALQMAIAMPESPNDELVELALGGADGAKGATDEDAADEDAAELSEFERHRRARQARQAQQAAQASQNGYREQEQDQQTPAPSSVQGSFGMKAALPALVRVNDERLAEAASALLEPLEVVVEYAPDLQHFEEAFAALAQSLGADPDAAPPEPFAWEIDNALLPPLYKAAADLWRRSPWDYLPDMPPIAVELGKHGPQNDTPILYATTLGGGGEIIGVVLHYSTEAVENTLKHGEEIAEQEASIEVSDEQLDEVIAALRQAGLPVDMLPADQLRSLARDAMAAGMRQVGEDDEEDPLALTEDALAVFFESPDEIDPTYLEWLDAHAIKYSTRTNIPAFYRMTKGIGSTAPTARETQALIIALEALNQFYRTQQHRLSDLEALIAHEPTITYDATVTPEGAHTTGAGKGAKTGSGSGAKTGSGSGAKAGAKGSQASSGDGIRVRVTYPAPGYTFARFFAAEDEEDENFDDEEDEEENLPLTFPFAIGAADLSDDASDENGDDGVGDEE